MTEAAVSTAELAPLKLGPAISNDDCRQSPPQPDHSPHHPRRSMRARLIISVRPASKVVVGSQLRSDRARAFETRAARISPGRAGDSIIRVGSAETTAAA